MNASVLDDRPPRTPWGAFPEVVILANESTVKTDPSYSSAKNEGDVDDAQTLVTRLLRVDLIATLVESVGNHEPVLASAHAYEHRGINAIPEVLADEIAKLTGWPVNGSIVQTNYVGHTGADGYARLARQPTFDGDVVAGAHYVMVDDFVGMGGTLANLRGHIETHGGKVIAAIVLTGKSHSARLPPSPDRLKELRERHGEEFENWWQQRFGHAFDALTESEARYLARSPDADTIRNRIAAAEQA